MTFYISNYSKIIIAIISLAISFSQSNNMSKTKLYNLNNIKYISALEFIVVTI